MRSAMQPTTPCVLQRRPRFRSCNTALRSLFLGAVFLLANGTLLHSQSPPANRTGGIANPSLDAKVESILARMTLEEKVGQLVQYSAGQPTGPGTGRTDYDDTIAKG